MWQRIENAYRLGIKELYSLAYDPVLMILIVYTFTFAIYAVAEGAKTEVRNASVAVVDEDRSPLSRRISDAIQEPSFRPPIILAADQIDEVMDAGRYTFVIDVPPDFQARVLAGHQPSIQLNVDATAMTQAGNGSRYLQSIISREIRSFVQRNDGDIVLPVHVAIRTEFNPNRESKWFSAIMQLINNVTLLAIILTGAALIREREHGTIEHLLVMPLRPTEIMLAKVWANGLVIVVAATLSLWLVVQWLLQVPIVGSIPLFLFGTVIYLFSVTSLGIFLATLARSMPQFGLLAIPVVVVMYLLSGGTTPLDSMPTLLQNVMQVSPSTHYVAFAQAILYRGAGFDVVWPNFAAIVTIGTVLFLVSLARFRVTLATMQT